MLDNPLKATIVLHGRIISDEEHTAGTSNYSPMGEAQQDHALHSQLSQLRVLSAGLVVPWLRHQWQQRPLSRSIVRPTIRPSLCA